ncbi:hypothetical protein G3N18_14480, partial [Microbacterium sp. 2C]|uniref:hypothetical protein n=1 Tax=Microbacterium paulum TaxID=2707006 RepID=UPI0018C2AD2E
MVAETATLSVVVLATFWFAPQLAVAYPDWHPLVHYAIPTVGAALLVALLKTFVFARAHVSVEWTRKGESSPLRELDAEVKRESKFGLHEYVATVEFQRAYGLGWVALQVGTRTGVWIRAEGVHAQLRSTRMWQDGPDNEALRTLGGGGGVEAAGDEEHAESVVVVVAEAAGDAAG